MVHTGKPQYSYVVDYISTFDDEEDDELEDASQSPGATDSLKDGLVDALAAVILEHFKRSELDTERFKEALVESLAEDGITDLSPYGLDDVTSLNVVQHSVPCMTKEAADQLPSAVGYYNKAEPRRQEPRVAL